MLAPAGTQGSQAVSRTNMVSLYASLLPQAGVHHQTFNKQHPLHNSLRSLASAGRSTFVPAASIRHFSLTSRILAKTVVAPPPGPPPPPPPPPPQPTTSSTAARPFTFGSRPFLHVLTFAVVHVGSAWALVPIVYAGLAMTGSANALLGGPQVAYILSRPVPQWVPFGGGKQKLVEVEEGDDDRKSSLWSRKKQQSQPKQRTVEDLLDDGIRSSILFTWTNAASVYKTIRRATNESGAERFGIKLPELIGPNETDAQEAVKGLKGKSPSTLEGWKSKAYDTMGKSARTGVQDIHIGQIRDAVGAWVLVKLLFPLRLPISLFLTPRVARFFARGLASSR